jgi:hypothetical protein
MDADKFECSACMICVLDKFYFTLKHVFKRKCNFFYKCIQDSACSFVHDHNPRKCTIVVFINVAAAEHNLRYVIVRHGLGPG